MGEAQHPTEALQDALDDRLDSSSRAKLDAHLSSCETCRLELAALKWTKAQAASLRDSEAPMDLEARLRAALDREDRSVPDQLAPPPRLPGRLLPWLAAAAALAAAVWIGGRFWMTTVPDSVAGVFRAHSSNALSLEVASSDAAELEGYLASVLPFSTRVFDLGMMGFPLEGARVQRVGGRDGALIAYRAADGRVLLCLMYEGRVSELPEPIDRHTNDGIAFQLYRDGELTLVFWQEGAVVCVLAAEGDPDAVLQLAFAKAVRL